MTLKELMQSGLPLNRKERFFTGTVFPMIVCRDNFKYFTRFTSLIQGCEGLEITAKPDSANIQFFTEYSLVESIYSDSAKRRFIDPPKSKDTPDIIILIDGETKTLIAIEAKMYDSPDRESLTNQMNHQKKHIDYLVKKLNISRAIQCALLPEELSRQVGNLRVHTITWEQIRDTYAEVLPDDYFVSLLRISLESYCELVAEQRRYGKNCERKMRGGDIHEKYKSQELDMVVMGRYLGLKGDRLLKDVQSGRWRSQEYETSSAAKPFNDNWFYIKDFVELVDKISS